MEVCVVFSVLASTHWLLEYVSVALNVQNFKRILVTDVEFSVKS